MIKSKWIFTLSVLSCMTSALATTNVSPPFISSNPAAVDNTVGNGTLQSFVEKQFKLKHNKALNYGGAWILDTNRLISGGIRNPQLWTSNSSFIFGATLDTKELYGWSGGMFGAQFLQYNGQRTNLQAGSVQGYNSLPGPKPLQRAELYQAWYRQNLFNNKLIVRIGKTVPTYDFNNVVKPVSLSDEHLAIPTVSSLIYTPIFVNSSTIGVLPGYYNSTYGIVLNLIPMNEFYFSFAVYDGNLANGTQTGMKVEPTLNGSYFDIAETGYAWLLGENRLPGNIGVGAWYQSGLIESPPGIHETNAYGWYTFGSQRLWYRHPRADASGIVAYFQYGRNNSDALPMTQYAGGGLTAYGLTPHRYDDSMGVGFALAWLNQHIFMRTTELMLQANYQAQINKNIYIEPVLSYIPTPGLSPDLKASWAGTLRAIILF